MLLQTEFNMDSLRAQVASASVAERGRLLKDIATEIRISVLKTISHAGIGHIGGEFSAADILATLFFGVLRVDPQRPAWEQRDRFILSKGHCAVSLYCVLAKLGFIDSALLPTFAGPLSRLNGHPNRRKVPGVESNTGALGHGLPFGVGCAVAARIAGADWRTYVVTGDGELQEGSNWEAAMCAGDRALANLTVVVDRNLLQQGARTEDTNRLEPLADKWRAFGWDVFEADGHDHGLLFDTFTAPPSSKPRCVITHTTKGKGVSFMQDRVEWHHKVPSPEQVKQAVTELEAE
jgi:transketolase